MADMDVDVVCRKCGSKITHLCKYVTKKNPQDHDHAPVSFRDAAKNLLSFSVEGGLPTASIRAAKSAGYYSPGDENAPFFTEAYLYNLLAWKDPARTVLHFVRELIEAGGFDMAELQREVFEEQRAKALPEIERLLTLKKEGSCFTPRRDTWQNYRHGSETRNDERWV